MKENVPGRCVIVAAGELKEKKIPVEKGDFVIAVDGGAAYCRRLGLEPDLTVGDFDSLEEQERERVRLLGREHPERVIALQPEKDDTDTLAAIRLGRERGFSDFWIYGGTGGRLEHTVANIQCLLYLKNRGCRGVLADGESRIFVLKEEERGFGREERGYLSLFALGERALGVTVRGMKYPLEEAEVTSDFPLGISNEFTGREALVRVRKGALLCIQSPFDSQRPAP